MTRTPETYETLGDVLHWVDGECRIRPEVKVRWEAENRRNHPHMTEEQIQASWGILEFTFGITVGPPDSADEPGKRRP